jgi:hypothetical protein
MNLGLLFRKPARIDLIIENTSLNFNLTEMVDYFIHEFHFLR